MPELAREVQTIRDLARAHHAEHGHTLNIRYITGHAIPGAEQKCVYTVTGRISGDCKEPYPVCMLFLRIENGFVLLSDGEVSHFDMSEMFTKPLKKEVQN